MDKTLLSLFDYSGEWSRPFAENGWNVIQWDIKLAEFMDINLITDAEVALELFEDVHGILAASPCDDVAACGAMWWPQKDASGQTAKTVALIHQVERLANLFRPTDPDYYEETGMPFFWALENPVGRMATLAPELGSPHYFQPWEFAGNLNLSGRSKRRLGGLRQKKGVGLTKQEVDFVIRCNAYTKKTGLWGQFNTNMVKNPIKPVRCTMQGSPTQKGGGKSAKTKEFRSNTPYGFAKAFYEANKDYQAPIEWE